MRRGDVFIANLNPAIGSEQGGKRPVIVVSRNAINLNSSVVIVVPVTGHEHARRIYPSQVLLKAGGGGLTKDSVALGEQIRAVSKKRLLSPLGHLSPQVMTALAEAIRIAVDLQ